MDTAEAIDLPVHESGDRHSTRAVSWRVTDLLDHAVGDRNVTGDHRAVHECRGHTEAL